MNRLTEYFFQGPSSIFSHSDVAATIEGTEFARNGLIKRALQNGEILGIRRGLYCLAPKYQKKPVNFYALSQRIYGPSYVSLEGALSYHGWIPEAVHVCSCASYGVAKEFKTPLGIFRYERIPQKKFYMDVDRIVDEDGSVFFMASPAKALADYVYARRSLWKSIYEAAESLRIEGEDLETVAPEDLGELAENYSSSRVRCFLTSWKESLP